MGARRYQYQGYTAPILVPVPPVLLEWLAPLSEPVRIELGLSAAWQQYFGGVTVPAPAAVTFIPPGLSEPTRIKRRVIAEHFYSAITTAAPVVLPWLTEWPSPVRGKRRIVSDYFSGVITTAAPAALSYAMAVTETGDFSTLQFVANDQFVAIAHVSISEVKVTQLCNVSIREIEQ